jgi:hypothetical protein
MQEEYDRHIKRKEEARALKDEHKLLAQNDDAFYACCFDLEQVLNCPHGTNNLFYYRRKLDVYNLSVYSLGDAGVVCYMWDQTKARRGASEIGSCLLDHLKRQAEKGKTAVAIYADNCGGQNKNRYILALMAYVVQTTPIEKIALCFLEKGHTQNENDSVH